MGVRGICPGRRGMVMNRVLATALEYLNYIIVLVIIARTMM